jgi:hypothetical protein
VQSAHRRPAATVIIDRPSTSDELSFCKDNARREEYKMKYEVFHFYSQAAAYLGATAQSNARRGQNNTFPRAIHRYQELSLSLCHVFIRRARFTAINSRHCGVAMSRRRTTIQKKHDMTDMKSRLVLLAAAVGFALSLQAKETDIFPDGTPMPAWFRNVDKADFQKLGKSYVITDYGVSADSTVVQTKAIQDVIDKAAAAGGGVIVVPKGTFLSGSLFFRQGTHLYLADGARLKGSDAIEHYKVLPTRIEGRNIVYFAALVNADGLDGFNIGGPGIIDGNGHRFWREFWIRRQINKDCTNIEAMRPRDVFLSNCRNVQIQDVHIINSAFWTSHYYKCQNVKILDVTFFAPHIGEKAPSSDAVDIDVCRNVLVHGCEINVNDDGVVLKGGKGTWADKDTLNNGINENVVVEHCHYTFAHGILTFGSESIHDRNIVLRHITVDDANQVIWFKMRPDTPQNYEYALFDDVRGSARNFITILPWTQFYNLEQRADMPVSQCSNVVIRNVTMKADKFFNVKPSEKYLLSHFTFSDLDITADDVSIDKTIIDGFTLKNVKLNGKVLK